MQAIVLIVVFAFVVINTVVDIALPVHRPAGLGRERGPMSVPVELESRSRPGRPLSPAAVLRRHLAVRRSRASSWSGSCCSRSSRRCSRRTRRTPPTCSTRLAPPSPQHWLGTNQVGQDTLSRLIYGARTSLIGPLAVVVLSTVLGIAVGLLAGWRGGWVDAGLSRVLDIMFAFPGLLLAILAVALFGKGLGGARHRDVDRLHAVRGAARPQPGASRRRSRPYVAAYQVQGFGSVHVAVRRLLPNIVPDRARPVHAELRVRRSSTSRRCRSSGSASSHPRPTGAP